MVAATIMTVRSLLVSLTMLKIYWVMWYSLNYQMWAISSLLMTKSQLLNQVKAASDVLKQYDESKQ